MADDKTGDALATKHPITFKAHVARSVSFDDVRAYLVRKGFRILDAKGETEAFALCNADVTWEQYEGEYVFLNREPPVVGRLGLMIYATAECLDRPYADVLREIAGEVVTLEDAWEALFDALRDCADAAGLDLGRVARANWIDRTAAGALAAGMDWRLRSLGALKYANGRRAWTHALRAAEDLAAIAIEQLRASRAAPSGGSDG